MILNMFSVLVLRSFLILEASVLHLLKELVGGVLIAVLLHL